MLIEVKPIAYNYSSREMTKIAYIVVHDTGNPRAGADREAHYRYFNGGDRGASAHYFVDDGGILQAVPDQLAAWHVGDGQGRYGITNRNSLGVEICINEDGDFHLAVSNALDVVSYLMRVHDLKPAQVVRHYDASRKICPRTMSENGWAAWWSFQQGLAGPEGRLRGALMVLVQCGVIDSPAYWREHARAGLTVRGDFAAMLIEKAASFIGTGCRM